VKHSRSALFRISIVIPDFKKIFSVGNTKLKNYLKRRYRNRHSIPMFIGSPCIICDVRDFVLTRNYISLLNISCFGVVLPEPRFIRTTSNGLNIIVQINIKRIIEKVFLFKLNLKRIFDVQIFRVGLS